jgi:hypothetical protein
LIPKVYFDTADRSSPAIVWRLRYRRKTTLLSYNWGKCPEENRVRRRILIGYLTEVPDPFGTFSELLSHISTFVLTAEIIDR